LPELPDVEAFKQYLDATSLHKSIEKIEVKTSEILGNISAQELRDKLVGHEFQSSRRYGKYLFVEIDGDSLLTLHFGMTGNLECFKDIEDEPPHTRLLITFGNGFHLAYDCQRKLGEINLAKDVDSFVKEKNLGPDALDLDFDTFRKIVEKRRGSLKYTLMNQHIIAGIGNIYSDEILFQAGIHPKTKANKLNTQTFKKLFDKIQNVLLTAVEHQADAENFPENYLIPSRSKGGKCPLCHSELERIKVSGRTTYYCPEHQKKIS
jgi:formamidopyrimidine-DNA glycosylase